MRLHYRYKSLLHFLRVQYGVTVQLHKERDFAVREELFDVLDSLMIGAEQAKRELLVVRFDDPPPPKYGGVDWGI